MEVSVRWRCQGINRVEDSLSAVERAEHLLAELWTRSDIAIISTEASARGLGLLMCPEFTAAQRHRPRTGMGIVGRTNVIAGNFFRKR